MAERRGRAGQVGEARDHQTSAVSRLGCTSLRDWTVQICGNYKLIIKKAAKLELYLLPHIKGLLASLTGGKTFTDLHLSHAYLQVKLDEESKKYVTVNTDRVSFSTTD